MYYVTKWFITKGILELSGTLSKDGKYVIVKVPDNVFGTAVRYGVDAFVRRPEAERRAKDLLKKKIMLTERQLILLKSKYEKMVHSEE